MTFDRPRFVCLLAVLSCWMCTSLCFADADEARSIIEKGKGYYSEGQYEQALNHFREAFSLSGSPNVQLAVARALRELERNVEAISTYEQTISLAGTNARYQRTVAAAQVEREKLLSSVGRVVLTVAGANSDVDVRVNGSLISPNLLSSPIVVPPGEVLIEVSGLAVETSSQRVSVEVGEMREISVEMQERRPVAVSADSVTGRRGWTTAGIVALGVGAAGLATFGTFWGLSERESRNLANRCGEGCTDQAYASLRSSGRTYQFLTNAGLGVAATGLVSGVIMTLVGRTSKDSKNSVPSVVVLPKGVVIKQSF